jgi:catechol 2,3-dioxygenase-like lactoylglutathione lyase family enzyme
MTFLGVDHVQLAAPRGCEDDARRFFGDVLGLVELSKPDRLRARGGVWFAVGQQQLHIGVEEPFSPALKAHPGLRVADHELDVLADRLAAAGADVQWDVAVAGVRRFYTHDPWGNRIELLTYV